MVFVNIFYCVFWVVMLLILWFKTDWVLHYCELLKIFKTFRSDFKQFLNINSHLYFPDFIYEKTYTSTNPLVKFLGKLISCPLCLGFWLSFGVCMLFGLNIILIAPIYVISLFIFLQIKKLI